MPDELWRARSLEHPALSVVIPVGFLWFALAALRSLFPSIPLAPGLPLLPLLAAVTESVVGNILLARQIGGILPLVRELAAVTAGVYLCMKIAGGQLFTGQWGVDASVGIGMFLALVSWLLAHMVHEALRPRELVLSRVLTARGGDTREALRDLGTDAADAAAGMRRVRRLVVGLQVVGLLLLLLVPLAAPNTEGVVMALGVLHAAAGAAALLVITGHMEWQDLLGRGFSPPKRIADRRTVFVVALCALACLLALALTPREAPLPSRYLEELLAWLGRVLSGRRSASALPRLPPDQTQQPFIPQPELPPIPPIPPGSGSPVLERLMRIFVVLLFGVPGAALAVALIAPLFRKHEGRLHPARALRSWLQRALKAFARGMKGFARAARSDRSLRRTAGPRRRTAARRPGPGGGVLEGLARGREIRLFARVVRWGERQGEPFRPSLGPREYTRRLGSRVPQMDAPLDLLAEILEESLYSGRRPKTSRTPEYVSAARRVLRHRP